MTKKNKWEIGKNQQLFFIKTLSAELTSLRAKIGVSQGELASLIGVSRQTYSAIECGKRLMSWNTYLALILFFDYNNATHQMIRNIHAFPEELILSFNNNEPDPYSDNNSIAGIPQSITEKLDAQAFHAIRTVVMIEYARCAKLSGEEVIKAFEGTSIRQPISDSDISMQRALLNIREDNNRK